jgi:antagonist of KipI
MSLTVLEPGVCSLIVDLGRPGHRSLGVPLGGAADRAAFLQGNALVGNGPDAAGLEFALVGPTLRAECDIAAVVFGTLVQASVRIGTTFTLRAGETLKIGPTAEGLRGYLCVSGGFTTRAILGSRSAFEPITKGQTLECGESHIAARSLADPILSFAPAGQPVTLRVLPGPQSDWFDLEAFLGHPFMVTPASNRMGLRLNGKPLERPERELVSEPVCPGTVQVVNDGQCIVLGVDGQTIGGYPKVAQVIAADLDALGQLRPGQALSFRRVTLAEAEVAFRLRATRLLDIIRRLQAARGVASAPR